MPTIHDLYFDSINADERYSQAISSVTAGKRNRWTMSPEHAAHQLVVDAFNEKQRAYQAWETAARAAR